MLSIKYRPRRFAEVIGQPESVAVLKSVVRDPESAPRVFILQGSYGTGKTSLSRVFARALNCLDRKNGDACLQCENCLQFTDFSANYQEYDSTQVGNVQYIRQLKEHLFYTKVGEGYRVVTFDEVHMASSQAMSALLKLLEEGPRDTFFMLATTDIDKVLTTIRSRAVELSFQPLADLDMKMLLNDLCVKEQIQVPSVVLDRIVSFSFGHVRNALMKMDLFMQVQSPEEFEKMLYVPERDILELFFAIKAEDRFKFHESLKVISNTPLAYLRKSFETFVMNSMRALAGSETSQFPKEYQEIANLYGTQLFNLLNVMASDWAINCFKSDLTFQALAWYFYTAFSKGAAVKKADDSRFRR